MAQRGVYRNRPHRHDLRGRFTHPTDVPRHTIFLEGGGNGLFYSLNYDRVTFRQMLKARSYRIGLNYVPRSGYQDQFRQLKAHESAFIFALNWFRGRSTHFFEWGLGYTFRWFRGVTTYKSIHARSDSHHKFYHLLVPSVGYRRQAFGRTPFLRLAFNPIIMLDQTRSSIHFLPYAGVGIGKSF